MCMEEKCEAADPHSGAKEKQRVRTQTLLHGAYPFLLLASMVKVICQFAFCKVVGPTHCSDGGRGWHRNHTWPRVAVGSFQPTVKHSETRHLPKQANPWQGNNPPHPSPSLSASRRSWGHSSWTLGTNRTRSCISACTFPPLAEDWGLSPHPTARPQRGATCATSITPAQGTLCDTAGAPHRV